MPLKDAASVASSSSPLSGIRTPRSPAARRRLVAAVARIGSMTPAHHDERDGAEQGEQCGGADDAGDLHERERLLGLGEVVADVELVAARRGHLEVAADDDARGRAAVGVRQRDGLPVLAAAVVLHLLAELGRDHPAAERGGQPVGRRHRSGGWPGSRKSATSVLPETLEIVPIAEAISSWSDARSAASESRG